MVNDVTRTEGGPSRTNAPGKRARRLPGRKKSKIGPEVRYGSVYEFGSASSRSEGRFPAHSSNFSVWSFFFPVLRFGESF